MATEQDWLLYSDQAYLLATDVLLVSNAAGTTGYNVPGSAIVAQRSAGGTFDAAGIIKSSLSGQAGFWTYNGGGTCEWFTGQRSGSSHGYTISKVVSGTYTDCLNIASDGSLTFGNSTDGWGRIVTAAGSGVYLQSGTQNSGSATVRDVIVSNMYGGSGGAALRGATDNAWSSGTGSYRWTTVYAATGTINTSDERDKLWIGIREDSRAVYARVARAILDELGWYQFLDAVAKKGENGARWHFGARAQRVWAKFADEGLAAPLVGEGVDQQPDPAWGGPPPPALLCFDRWEEETAERPIYSDTLLGPDGEPALIRTETVITREAGNRFGFRLDQLGLLLDWSLNERISALEAAK